MDKKRIREEVIEILSNKLHKLPPLPVDGQSEDIDYDNQALRPEITDNHLDIAEVAMDLEDAFGVTFEDVMPGDQGMETIGKLVAWIEGKISTAKAKA